MRKKSNKIDQDGPPGLPQVDVTSAFPSDAASILRKYNINKKQYQKYVEQMSLYMLTRLSADAVNALQKSIKRGEKSGMEMFFKMIGLLRQDSGVAINLQQNVINQGGGREFDSIVRMLDSRDRREQVIDVVPVAGILEAPDSDDDGDDE